MRQIAAKRAALDAEEARWLREAERCQIWRQLGMVSALDYMERVLGYAPRTAFDRLRVARALGTLPVLTTALADGRLTFSAIRELTRVATPATESAWCDAAADKNLRQIEELVADHKPGDRPEDPGDPAARTHTVRFELSAPTFALMRQAWQALGNERGASLSDDELMAAMCNAVLERASAPEPTETMPSPEPTGRAKFQIAVIVCRRCKQGWQEGAGARVAINDNAVERAMCDAQHIGAIDGDGNGDGNSAGARQERAYQDVAPSVARFVWRRDGGRCRVPGCRSTRSLEIHHIVHREHGGNHDALNLILACSACHVAHHDGLLKIAGTAEQLTVERRAENATTRAHVGAVDAADRAHVGAADRETPRNDNSSASPVPPRPPSKLQLAELRTQAKQALTGLGWKPAIAIPAVDAALAALIAQSTDITLEQTIREALRRCPRPVIG